jgi:hypothetical protein
MTQQEDEIATRTELDTKEEIKRRMQSTQQ